MSIVRTIAKKLTKFPRMKRMAKNCYCYAGNLCSDKKTNLPGLIQVSSNGKEHNFGYYDKCPWSRDQKYMIYVDCPEASKNYVSEKAVSVILLDRETGTEQVLTETHVWNSQQGCMLQWLGPDFSSRILFNDFRDGKYCSVIYTLEDKSEKVLNLPVYTVSEDGKTAISLDFSRLNTFRPGYGYSNLPDLTAREKCPDSPCMWRMDLETNMVSALPISYKFLAQWNRQPSMQEGYHKVNHIMLNPSADRFMFIHRWIVNGVTHHRLLTCDIQGENLYLLLDDGMVSHNNWRDDTSIISYSYAHSGGEAYYLLYDQTQKKEIIGKDILTLDGHPSYSPDRKYIITDTYPDFRRKQNLYLIRVLDGRVKKLGSIYASPRYRNEMRCDLHPRWNYNSEEICFDGAEKSKRQVYILKVDKTFDDLEKG